MKKVIGYIRVSTQEQACKGVSLDNQRDKIKAYCNLNDLELIEIISDAGRSGKDLKRPGIEKLINIKDIAGVIVYKLDRLSRKVKDTLQLIESFEKRDITFHSITERIDTRTAIGKFFLNITASLAQMERDLISERTIDALQYKIKNGERAGQIPYGYILSKDNKTLIENPAEQKAIKLILELKDQGYSLIGITRELEIKGHKPRGKKWYAQSVKNILLKAV